jgi:hypothetical protein
VTLRQLETRLDIIENLIAHADAKDLPKLNETYQKLLDRIVNLDLAGKDREDAETWRASK